MPSTETDGRRSSVKRWSVKFGKLHRKTPVMESFFSKVASLGLQLYQKGNPYQVLCCKLQGTCGHMLL